MDTKKDSAVTDIPVFKVARVGKERKRKGAGFSWWRGAGAREGWRGAIGGSGAAGLGASKTLIAVLAACGIGSAAIYAGSLSASRRSAASVEKAKIFASGSGDVKIDSDASDLPSNSNTIPNSLGYVAGSLDGLTPEERARRAAEAAEAQRKAEEEAKKAEAQPAADPGALLAAAKADGGNSSVGALGRMFGRLSSGTGGGSALAGGAGLSGGVNRQFASASLAAGNAGKLTAMQGGAKPRAGRAARSSLAASKVKGFAKQQLVNAAGLSRRGAAASKGETAAYEATSAFDNNPGAGNPIAGPGIDKGKVLSGPTDVTPNPVVNPPGQTPACSGTQYPDPKTGACVDTKEPAKKNVTPWEMYANIAQLLLLVISIIALVVMIMEGSVVGVKIIPALANVIAVLGGIVAALGIVVISMGDYFAGTVFTAVGAFIALIASTEFLLGPLTAAPLIVTSAAGMMLAQAAKMLKPAAAD